MRWRWGKLDQSGNTLAELGGSFAPRGEPSGNVEFRPPNAERGGFFRARDLYGSRLPAQFSAGADLPSTNNWRLLGMGPGYIMRNGKIINIGAARTGYGFGAGRAPMSGVSGEVEMSHVPRIPFGSAPPSYGFPNAFMGNYGTSTYAGWPGQVDPWSDMGSRAVT